jgi:geranylgeranyl diphosphate synthase, type II
MDFKSYLQNHQVIVDEYLYKILLLDQGPERQIVEAMRYSIFAGGKRLRPILVFAGGDLIKDGLDRSIFLPFAAAIEMIHTYSLIHDDLPAMDDDDLRRGKPSCHKKFSEGIAILAGDALLTFAFQIMSENGDIPSDVRVKVIKEYSKAAGYHGMVGGQVLDLGAEGKELSIQELGIIHLKKTANLIAAPLLAGSILAGASDAELVNVSEYGINLGHAFQIVDDILDVIGDEKVIGKKVGSDKKKDKVTYPSLCGLDRSRIWAREFNEKAKDALAPFGERAEFLLKLADFVISRSH